MFKKLISFVLVINILAQMVPAMAVFDSKTNAQSLEIPKTTRIEAEIQPSSVADVKNPPTFILDDSCYEGTVPVDKSQNNLALIESSVESTSVRDGEILPDRNVGAPYAYDNNSVETINLNTGAIVYETIDYTLPGVNGLDLIIKRRYDSQWAKVYDPCSDIDYYDKLYALGKGWSFAFSSIEIIQNTKYLHLADGNVYKIGFDSAGLYLNGHSLSDLLLKVELDAYNNGFVSSVYTLYYKNGIREFFSNDGKLIGIKDRYDNTINFVNNTLNGYPKITITDTLNRVITISGQSVGEGHKMIVTLPNSVLLTYTIYSITSPAACSALAEYNDPMNVSTAYSYTVHSGGFDIYNKTTNANENYFIDLTTITYPTGAQSVYTYDPVNENLGANGLQICYRISSRADKIAAVSYNEKTYSYSTNNYTGYPIYPIPSILPESYTYSTTVSTTATDVNVKHIFDNMHRTTQTSAYLGNTIIQEQLYNYDTSVLPTKVIEKTYNSSNQNEFMQSVKAYTYDNKGNITASWSPLANGDTSNSTFKTIYTYDTAYNLPLTISYNRNSSMNIQYKYTLDSTGKSIERQEILANNFRKSMTDYTYDSYGNVISKKMYKNDFNTYNEIQYIYENNAYLSEQRVSNVLDADNNLVIGSPQYNSGTIVTLFEYDTLGRMTKSTDQNGGSTTYNYDKRGNLTQITNPDNTDIQYNRSYTDNYLTIIDEENNQVKYTYTALGLENQIIDVLTNMPMQSKTYDSLSRLKTVTDSVYNNIKTYSYDYLSRVTTEKVTQGNTLLEINYAYTDACENGTLQKVTKTIVGDDHAPSVVTTSYTNNMGLNVKNGKIFNGEEHFDTYTYDYCGNLLSETRAGWSTSSTWDYDYAGNITKAHKAGSRYAETFRYDTLGNLIASTDCAGKETSYSYDSLCRRLTMQTPIDVSNSHYGTTDYYYDAAGNIIRTAKSDNGANQAQDFSYTDYEYNARGRLISVKAYDYGDGDNITMYTYDGVGNVTSICTGMDSDYGQGLTSFYTYDRYGNVLTYTDQRGNRETNVYTALGMPVSKTDRNGNSITYVYDGLKRLLATEVTGTTIHDQLVTTYSLTGQKEREENYSNATFRPYNYRYDYAYDELGRLTVMDESTGAHKEYSYDLADNRTAFKLDYEGNLLLDMTYDYDNGNRLEAVYEGETLQAGYEYDFSGNRKTMFYANDVETQYTYNDANWLANISNVNLGTGDIISSYAYNYYANGNQSQKVDNEGYETVYEYDDIGRLAFEQVNNAEGNLEISYEYEYDRFNNRTQMLVSGNENYSVSQQYVHEGNKYYFGLRKTDPSGHLTEYYVSFYDGNGNNEFRQGSIKNPIRNFNGFNQLVYEVVPPNMQEIAYTYDPSGLRKIKQSKSQNGDIAETEYILDGGNVVAEITNGTVSATYIYGINLISSKKDNEYSYYVYNGHGDVVQLTNTTGEVIANYKYDAFGNVKNLDTTDTNPFRYCGEYYDLETNTYYLRARNYDPTTGRFLSEDTHWNPTNMIYGDNPVKWNERKADPNDPLCLNTYTYKPDISAIMQSGNLYAYGLNNPLMYQDPTGEAAINTVFAAIGAIGGWAFGDYVATNLELEGWKYWTVRGAVTVGGAAIGWFAGGAISGVAKSFLLANPAVMAKMPSYVLTFLGIQQVATGQWHHVLSNPIMNALGNHPTLKGLFDRAGSTVQALTEAAHRGYQTWHRVIDNTMVQWLNNNPNATTNQFWQQMYNLYNTPDMIERFGQGVLKYIEGVMK